MRVIIIADGKRLRDFGPLHRPLGPWTIASMLINFFTTMTDNWTQLFTTFYDSFTSSENISKHQKETISLPAGLYGQSCKLLSGEGSSVKGGSVCVCLLVGVCVSERECVCVAASASVCEEGERV